MLLARHRLPAAISLLGVVALLSWDQTRGDLWLAHLAGNEQGFALRDHWLLATVLHEGGRRLSWLVALLLCVGVWRPWASLRPLDFSRRLQLAVSSLAAALAVGAVKHLSGTSCPWDLQQFGGLAQYLSHWSAFWTSDGGIGHCFPAGHASAGFGFVAGWFVWRPIDPVRARRWLAGALAAGTVMGLGQQWRGAHFMSHTLWSTWICWNTAWAMDALFADWHRASTTRRATGEASPGGALRETEATP